MNAVARKEDKNTANTNPYITKFLRKSKWRPKKINFGKVIFKNGGALKNNLRKITDQFQR